MNAIQVRAVHVIRLVDLCDPDTGAPVRPPDDDYRLRRRGDHYERIPPTRCAPAPPPPGASVRVDIGHRVWVSDAAIRQIAHWAADADHVQVEGSGGAVELVAARLPAAIAWERDHFRPDPPDPFHPTGPGCAGDRAA